MRPIDADALNYTKAFAPCGNGNYETVNIIYETDIDAMPTIDAVPVVRCKDCKYGTYYHGIYGCEVGLHDDDFFCADGERSEE